MTQNALLKKINQKLAYGDLRIRMLRRTREHGLEVGYEVLDERNILVDYIKVSLEGLKYYARGIGITVNA